MYTVYCTCILNNKGPIYKDSTVFKITFLPTFSLGWVPLVPLCRCAAGCCIIRSRVEKLFHPPSAQRACNHRRVCSYWIKWIEEYLKAYHWHCITQNSFCLCYAHLSLLIHIWHGWMVILPGENWKRLCAALQYVLSSSLWMFLWSTEAAMQQSRE